MILCSHLVVGFLFHCAVNSAHQGWRQLRVQSGGQDSALTWLGRNHLTGHGIKYNIKRKIGSLFFPTLSPTSVVSIRAALVLELAAVGGEVKPHNGH